jgi:hypothetical protein
LAAVSEDEAVSIKRLKLPPEERGRRCDLLRGALPMPDRPALAKRRRSAKRCARSAPIIGESVENCSGCDCHGARASAQSLYLAKVADRLACKRHTLLLSNEVMVETIKVSAAGVLKLRRLPIGPQDASCPT